MDVEDRLEQFGGEVVEGLVPQDSGVVDDDVDPAETLDSGGDDGFASFGVETLLPSETASPPALRISSATVSAGPLFAPSPVTEPPRSLTTTRAPLDARSRACWRPRPRRLP